MEDKEKREDTSEEREKCKSYWDLKRQEQENGKKWGNLDRIVAVFCVIIFDAQLEKKKDICLFSLLRKSLPLRRYPVPAPWAKVNIWQAQVVLPLGTRFWNCDEKMSATHKCKVHPHWLLVLQRQRKRLLVHPVKPLKVRQGLLAAVLWGLSPQDRKEWNVLCARAWVVTPPWYYVGPHAHPVAWLLLAVQIELGTIVAAIGQSLTFSVCDYFCIVASVHLYFCWIPFVLRVLMLHCILS